MTSTALKNDSLAITWSIGNQKTVGSTNETHLYKNRKVLLWYWNNSPCLPSPYDFLCGFYLLETEFSDY